MSFEEKTCPQCAEKIKLAALVCRHCGKVFDGADVLAQQRKSRRELGTGCATLIALAALLAWCTSSATPTAKDWFAPDARSAITDFSTSNDHLNVDLDAGTPADLGKLPGAIAEQLRAVHSRLVADKRAQATKTVTVGVWFHASKDKGGGREPLMLFEGLTADFAAVAADATDTLFLDAFDTVRSRPPRGDMLMKEACAQAPAEYAASKACLD